MNAPCPLTPRQVQVLALLSAGKPAKGAAAAMKVTVNVVNNDIKLILARLQVQNAVAAVATAIRNGWIE